MRKSLILALGLAALAGPADAYDDSLANREAAVRAACASQTKTDTQYEHCIAQKDGSKIDLSLTPPFSKNRRQWGNPDLPYAPE